MAKDEEPKEPKEARRHRRGSKAWRTEVSDELDRLPETLRQFREGVANFQTISNRLMVATEMLERTTQRFEDSGLLDAVRTMDDTTRAMKEQMTAAVSNTPGLSTAINAMDELAKRNPFLRRPSS